MKKIIYIIILFFIGNIFVKANYEVTDYRIDVTVINNGDIEIMEAFKLNGEYNGFERNIEYKNNYDNYYGNILASVDPKLYEGTGFKLEEIRAINFSNEPFEILRENGDVFAETKTAKKGEHGLYTISKTENGQRIKIYNPSIMNKDFYLKYTIKNMAVKHLDISELEMFLFNNIHEEINNLELKIHVPNNKKIINAWTHKNSNIEILDSENIKINIEKIKENESLDFRLLFDKDLIDTNKVTKEEIYNKIFKIEKKIQENKNFNNDNEYIKKKEEAYNLTNVVAVTLNKDDYIKAYNATINLDVTDELRTQLLIKLISIEPKIERKEEFIKIIFSSIMMIWILGICYFMYQIYKKNNKVKIEDYNPQRINPGLLGILLRNKLNINDLVASFLYLIDKKIITYEYNKKTLKFKLNNTKNLSNSEQKLIRFLFNEKNEITLNYINKRSKKDFDNYLKRYSNWIDAVFIESREHNYYYNLFYIKFIGSIYCVVGLIIGVILLNKNTYFSSIIIIFASIVFFILFAILHKRTKNGKEQYIKWKNYEIDNKITLDNIIYSISLGIFDKKYKNQINEQIELARMLKKTLTKSLKNAYEEKKINYN